MKYYKTFLIRKDPQLNEDGVIPAEPARSGIAGIQATWM